MIEAPPSILGVAGQLALSALELEAGDHAVSIEIDQAPTGLVVELINPSGLTVASADLPTTGSVHVLDAPVATGGTYIVSVFSLDGVTRDIHASVARTVAVRP